MRNLKSEIQESPMLDLEALKAAAKKESSSLVDEMAPGVQRMSQEEARAAWNLLLAGDVRAARKAAMDKMTPSERVLAAEAQDEREEAHAQASHDAIETERAWGLKIGAALASLLLMML
jgi:hypothetical protein